MGGTQIHGYRARIGYTVAAVTTEVYPVDWYRIVPAGVSLMMITVPLGKRSPDDLEKCYQISIEAAHTMAAAGAELGKAAADGRVARRRRVDLAVHLHLLRGASQDVQRAQKQLDFALDNGLTGHCEDQSTVCACQGYPARQHRPAAGRQGHLRPLSTRGEGCIRPCCCLFS